MNQPHLFAENNQVSRTEARYLLDNYFHLVRLREHATIIDIGCGDGGGLHDLLVPKLPQNYEKIYGIDISKEFVEYASKHNTNKRIVFEQFDIGSKQLPVKYCERFDLIFSCFCLHWVPDQKQAFENVYRMLRPDGDTLFVLLATFPFHEIYEATYSKWSKYMDDMVEVISPYQHSEHPEIEIGNLLKRQGFVNFVCEKVARSYTFPDQAAFVRVFVAVNPFVSRIPKHKVDDYINECIEAAKQLKTCTFDSQEGKIRVDYDTIVVYAAKPKN